MELVAEASEPIALFAVLFAAIVAVVSVLATTLGIYSHRAALKTWHGAMLRGRAARDILRSLTVLATPESVSDRVRADLKQALAESRKVKILLDETPISVLVHPGWGADMKRVLDDLDLSRRRAEEALSLLDESGPPPDDTPRW